MEHIGIMTQSRKEENGDILLLKNTKFAKKIGQKIGKLIKQNCIIKLTKEIFYPKDVENWNARMKKLKESQYKTYEYRENI